MLQCVLQCVAVFVLLVHRSTTASPSVLQSSVVFGIVLQCAVMIAHRSPTAWPRVSQGVAVSCSVFSTWLQRVAVCCSVLQCVAVRCSVLQCNVIVAHRSPAALRGVLQCVAVCCSILRYVAVCCSVLQCVAVCCSVLQCVAVCCSVSTSLTSRNTQQIYSMLCTNTPTHKIYVCTHMSMLTIFMCLHPPTQSTNPITHQSNNPITHSSNHPPTHQLLLLALDKDNCHNDVFAARLLANNTHECIRVCIRIYIQTYTMNPPTHRSLD